MNAAATADCADMTQPSLAALVTLQNMHVCQSWLSGRPSLWTHSTNSDRDVLLRSEFEGYSDDETVRVVMTGNQEPKSVDITDSAYEQGSDVSLQSHSKLLSPADHFFVMWIEYVLCAAEIGSFGHRGHEGRTHQECGGRLCCAATAKTVISGLSTALVYNSM